MGNKPSNNARRNFLAQAATLAIAGVGLAVPALSGLFTFFDSWRRKGGGGQSIQVATLEAIGDTPRQFPVIADRSDAWNRFANEPIGGVFLRRVGDKVEAFQVVCPHAGCFIDYDQKGNKFFCPCHSASFTLAGEPMDSPGVPSPSPRPLDTLEVEVRNGSEVWVKFEKFRIGVTEKIREA
ncbi:MAG: Rieske 2Fe-2S domain-containing protein [Pirellulales bacterium]